MRNGSSHHSAYISGRMTSAAPTTLQRRFGKIVNRIGRGVAVDHHQVDEVRGHLHDVVLEPRQQHQQHDQRQRQRARQRRTPQQRDKEEVQDAPRQRKTHAAAEIGFGLQHDRQRRHVRCSNGRKPPEADGGKAGDKGGGGGPWIWRGRHGRQRNMTRRNTKPWLATDQETHDQPEPVSRHKNVV